MKISARNQISGTIVGMTPGAVNGSIKELGLAEGETVTVVVKASDVMIGK